ncbi:hypothetical protein [Pseudovibrio sp. Alg231-02]|uniref:hypothetical protein n=1 Tax=Pseudovibrio sp. Alg231-02 TaxID=1922223 RepID=UPI0018FF976F|nr:hypothetical protein [Pseudovibrio sp. Alg231-02]
MGLHSSSDHLSPDGCGAELKAIAFEVHADFERAAIEGLKILRIISPRKSFMEPFNKFKTYAESHNVSRMLLDIEVSDIIIIYNSNLGMQIHES